MDNEQQTFINSRENLANYLKTIHANRYPISLLLDGVSDIRNIAAMFRLADAARLEKIYFYRNQPDSPPKKLSRVARSTDKYVPHQLIEDFEKLHAFKHTHDLIALEITNQSIPHYEYQPKPNRPILLIIGSEKYGVSPDLLHFVDATVHIPMMGVNTSMNVACATGIVVYRWLEVYLSTH